MRSSADQGPCTYVKIRAWLLHLGRQAFQLSLALVRVVLLKTIVVYKIHCRCSGKKYNAIMPNSKDVNAHTHTTQKYPTEPIHKNIVKIVCTSFLVRFWKISVKTIGCLIPSHSQFAFYFEMVPSVAPCGSKRLKKYHVSRDPCLRRRGNLELSFGIARVVLRPRLRVPAKQPGCPGCFGRSAGKTTWA